MDTITSLSAFFFFAIYSIMAHGLMVVLADIRVATSRGEPPSVVHIGSAWAGVVCMALLPPVAYVMLKAAGIVPPISAATAGILVLVWFASLLPGIFAGRATLRAGGIDPDGTASILN